VGETIVEDILYAFEQNDGNGLRKLALDLARRAAVDHDKTLARYAVVSYALSKLLTKSHIQESPNWPRYRHAIISALKDVEHGRETKVLERIERTIWRIDESDGHFIKNVIEKARSKMAAEAYATGISLFLAARLFDADIQDLSDYVGKMKIHDEILPRIGIKERVEAFRRLLNENRA
jgi:hypothetical protein